MDQLNSFEILGLDTTYNKSDAIDSYNSLTLWYKNNTVLSKEEKSQAIKILTNAIKDIIDSYSEQTSFNEQFNRDFLNNYLKQQDCRLSSPDCRFGYIEKIE